MEPVTHLLTGACLARAGLNRKAAYATLAMTLAAEMPDLDTIWSIGGPVTGFEHHRGWTHTLLGIPFEALVLTSLVWLLHRWRLKRNRITKSPVRWPLLWLFCLLALGSHLLLDWTNNYGLRPFFPFDPRWYAGSFVFIFEPFLFLFLVVGLTAPALFGLIQGEIGARREYFPGRGWALAALLATVALWAGRAYEHAQALALAAQSDYTGGTPSRLFASPEPLNPFRWHIVADLPDAYQLALADTRRGTLTATPDDLLYKPPTTLYTLPAKRGYLGEIYLDWSSYPLVTDIGTDGDGFTEVTFRDLRFMYDTTLLRGRAHPPLGGTVYLDADRRIRLQELNGRAQH